MRGAFAFQPAGCCLRVICMSIPQIYMRKCNEKNEGDMLPNSAFAMEIAKLDKTGKKICVE